MDQCGSTAENEDSVTARAFIPAAAVALPPPTQAAPKVEPKVATRPVEGQPVAVDPLNDPNSPLAKRSIYYDFDRPQIKDEFKPVIQAHAGYLTLIVLPR